MIKHCSDEQEVADFGIILKHVVLNLASQPRDVNYFIDSHQRLAGICRRHARILPTSAYFTGLTRIRNWKQFEDAPIADNPMGTTDGPSPRLEE